MKCSRCFFTDEVVDDERCRRCSRNLTRREIVEVVLLGLVYLLLCRFSYYLFTGDYVEHLGRGGMSFSVPFANLFTQPVNLAEHPWHVLTVGWTFALIIAVPALAAAFYGPVAGVVLALVGGYHVVVPFFFVLLASGAVVAGTRVRRLLGFATALSAALLVPLLYLFALTFAAALESVGVSAFAPWGVTAAAGSALVAAVAWAAKRRDWNASFLSWTLAVQGAAIFVIFYASVGFSKVEYEFLRQANSAAGATFRILVTASADREAALAEFERRRAKALREFSRFVSWFPRSPETPMALFERAEIWNLRPEIGDATLLPYGPKGAAHNRVASPISDQLHGYTDRNTPEALADYKTIRADFPTTLVVVEARLRAGRCYLQNADFDNGLREMRDLIDYCDVRVMDWRPSSPGSVLLRWRTHRLNADEETQLLYEALQEARAEVRFVEQNSDYYDVPIKVYYQTDPREASAVERFEGILKWYPDSRIADNLRLALLERGRWSIEQMRALYEQCPSGDAAPRMLLLLGIAWSEKRDAASAEAVLRKLVTDFPDSYEAARAGTMLRNLKPAGKP